MNSFKQNNNFTMCYLNASASCRLSIEYPLTSTWYYVAIASDCAYKTNVFIPSECNGAETTTTTTSSGAAAASRPQILQNQTLASMVDTLFPGISKATFAPTSEQMYCVKTVQPIETFRFIGPTYFSVKYYFNSNYNRSNTLLVRNERKPYFIEFLVDFANNGGTLNFYLGNNLIYDPNYTYEQAANHQTSAPPTPQMPSSPFSSFSSSSSTSDTIAFSKTTTASVNHEQVLSGNNNASTSTPLADQQNLLIKNRLVGASYDFNSKLKDFNLANIKIILKVCLLFNSMDYRNCPYGYELSVQSFTHIFTNLQLSVPYPMIGKWYLAVWKECYDVNSK
jgi:hypothetical protein